MIQKQKISLRILRGVHNNDMIDEVFRLIEDCTIVFVEMIAPAKYKDDFEVMANAITMNSEYVDSLTDENIEWFTKHPERYYRLLWRARKSGKVFIAVDETTTLSEDQLMGKYNLFNNQEMSQLGNTLNFASFYRSFNKHLSWMAVEISKRDQLVARQIAECVPWLEKNHCAHERMALVQGYEHQSEQYIKKLLPNISITEHTYNIRNDTNNPDRILLTKMLAQHKQHPNDPVDTALIDRMVLGNVRLVFELPYVEEDDDKRRGIFFTLKLSLSNLMQRNMYRKINGLTDDAVHQNLIVALGKYGKMYEQFDKQP